MSASERELDPLPGSPFRWWDLYTGERGCSLYACTDSSGSVVGQIYKSRGTEPFWYVYDGGEHRELEDAMREVESSQDALRGSSGDEARSGVGWSP